MRGVTGVVDFILFAVGTLLVWWLVTALPLVLMDWGWRQARGLWDEEERIIMARQRTRNQELTIPVLWIGSFIMYLWSRVSSR